MKKTTGKPILTTLRELEIGCSVTYPIERTSYLRSACTSFGVEWNKTFKTSIDRESRVITVTRTA